MNDGVFLCDNGTSCSYAVAVADLDLSLPWAVTSLVSAKFHAVVPMALGTRGGRSCARLTYRSPFQIRRRHERLVVVA
ncbi:hypothetical protein E2562_033044 [Oryza meyeriana var. granulata]|uniref:Uncharacterized protein n=1 Tax=Oryza meyeriana var. granulata TaxID=110450 RepID=A0A6G1CKK7_9ORYZ|nr:hypothetical protein E2562_033044 [Oryza meyeriana var. granulata]